MRSILVLITILWLLAIDSTSAQLIPSSPKIAHSQQPEQPQKRKKTETTETTEKPLDFSDTGRPGQQTAGESRSGCRNLDRPLKALLPVSHSGKTVSARPSFWVYFPYDSEHIERVEFIVQNEAREDVWRSHPQVNTTTGYQNFALPKAAKPLEVGEWYRWYVKVYCQSQVASTQYVQGWVKRVPLSSKLYVQLQDLPQRSHQAYGTAGIWYDAIDSLLERYHFQPSNLSLEKDWQNLLRAKGVKLHNLPYIGATFEAIEQ